MREPAVDPCMYCGDESHGAIEGVRLCRQCLAYAHDEFDLPLTLDDTNAAAVWRERGYEVL